MSELYRPNQEKSENKEDYESMITKRYFEDWDKFNIEGNPEIKDTIRKNIIETEKSCKSLYERAANGMGISVEEFKERFQRKIADMIQNSQFFIAVPMDIFEKIVLVDGRWKSQFETAASKGKLDLAHRATQEKNTLVLMMTGMGN